MFGRDLVADKADGTDLTIAPDTNPGEGSLVANRVERIGNERLPAQNVSTPTPKHGDGNASECDRPKLLQLTFIPVPIELQGRGRADGGTVETWSARVGRNPPAPHSAERDSQVRNRRGHEDRPSKTAPGGTTGSDQDGEDTYGLVQSKRSKGEC